MFVKNLFYARPFSITCCGKGIKMFSQLYYSLYFAPESEIRAAKLLVDRGHLQEELVGGCPHHRYRRACAAILG
jgi:hypothetical protein